MEVFLPCSLTWDMWHRDGTCSPACRCVRVHSTAAYSPCFPLQPALTIPHLALEKPQDERHKKPKPSRREVELGWIKMTKQFRKRRQKRCDLKMETSSASMQGNAASPESFTSSGWAGWTQRRTGLEHLFHCAASQHPCLPARLSQKTLRQHLEHFNANSPEGAAPMFTAPGRGLCCAKCEFDS